MPNALRQAGAEVRLIKEEFGEGAADADWLPEVGRRGWLLVTRDARIRRNPVEKAAYVNAGVRGFFLTARRQTGPERAALLAKMMPKMVQMSERYLPPFIAFVRASGVEVYDKPDCPAVKRSARKKRR